MRWAKSIDVSRLTTLSAGGLQIGSKPLLKGFLSSLPRSSNLIQQSKASVAARGDTMTTIAVLRIPEAFVQYLQEDQMESPLRNHQITAFMIDGEHSVLELTLHKRCG